MHTSTPEYEIRFLFRSANGVHARGYSSRKGVTPVYDMGAGRQEAAKRVKLNLGYGAGGHSEAGQLTHTAVHKI